MRTVADRNTRVARQTFEAICRRDIDGLLELYDPAIEFEPLTGLEVESRGYHGHAGVRRYFTEVEQVWEQMLPRADSVHCFGDRVLIQGGCAVQGRGSGAISDSPMAWVLTIKDGKVARHHAYRSSEEAFDELGLNESPPLGVGRFKLEPRAARTTAGRGRR
jgi:ketosteroid isomerase-like protein